jgi:hypothetical protein
LEETQEVANSAVSSLAPVASGLALVKEMPHLVRLELVVTDTDSITELTHHEEVEVQE